MSYLIFIYAIRVLCFQPKLTTCQATSRSTTQNPSLPSYTQPTQQSNRRLSVASIVGSVTSDIPTTRPNGYSKEPSNPPTANPPRPGSSQSIRPDSSMSSRAHSIPPVVVKKTRAPANTRVEPPKPRVRRKSPLNDIGKVVGRSDGTLDPLSKAGRVSLSSKQRSKSETPDIDDLTSGIKKININLITKV
jgi:histone deacetylase HOS3